MLTRRGFFALALAPLVAPFLAKSLAAAASTGGGVSITIIDRRAAGDFNGREQLELLIRDRVKKNVASGQLDREIARQFPRAGGDLAREVARLKAHLAEFQRSVARLEQDLARVRQPITQRRI